MNKIQYYLKILAISLTVLLSFLGMLTTIFGFIFWFISGFNRELLWGSIGWLAITIITSSIVNKYKHIWDEYYAKRKATSPKIIFKPDFIIRSLFIIIIFISLFNYLRQLFGPFPENIPVDVAMEILKIIINIDGILIGLLGVALFRIPEKLMKNIRLNIVVITFMSFIISIFNSINNMTLLSGTSVITDDIILLPLTNMILGICAFVLYVIYLFSYSANVTSE